MVPYACPVLPRLALCLGAAIAAVAAGTAAPALAAFPGSNGRVSFSSEGDIWSMAPDGSGVTRLTTTTEEEAQSVFSPDGNRIAYRRRPTAAEPYQVYVMNADGSDQRRVSNSAVNDTQPAWSPDSTQILYRRSIVADPNADVWAMNADGSGAHPLIESPGADERYPVFSPDGTRLAFASDRDGQYEIYVAAANGALPLRLTTDPGYDSAPSWSPDSSRIAFERGAALDVDPTKDIWIMGANGLGQTKLAGSPDVDEGPAFSPDGTQIAFTSARDGNYEIYRMGADGSGQTRLTNLATKEESPDWQARPATAPPGPAAPGSTPLPPGSKVKPGTTPAPANDRDDDGLSARRERELKTSDLDRDSDDDGLSDRREAPRGGTSPSRRDTDRDGLTDGVESAIRKPIADPPGKVRGTSRKSFRADADPKTRTSATRRDTDRDGRTDGREDRNHNGRVDRGESDPRRR